MADDARKIANMNRPFLICALFFLTQTNAFAQNGPGGQPIAKSSQTESATLQQETQTQKEMTKSQQALRDFLNTQSTNRNITPGASADLDAKFLAFRMAVPKFREATEEYGWNLGLKGDLDKYLKNIETQADILLRYLSAAKINHPRPDAQEFKDFSQSELEWETLNVAERISSFLNLAVAVERKNVVTAETLEFLFTLDGELLRLKWLISHTK